MGNHARWPHQTTGSLYNHDEPEAGLDLFDEDADGIAVTAIYIRFRDGSRYPARTVNTTEYPDHAQAVLDAWSLRSLRSQASPGTIHDYRQHPTIIPHGPAPRIPLTPPQPPGA